jgi:hypothetical protein
LAGAFFVAAVPEETFFTAADALAPTFFATALTAEALPDPALVAPEGARLAAMPVLTRQQGSGPEGLDHVRRG